MYLNIQDYIISIPQSILHVLCGITQIVNTTNCMSYSRINKVLRDIPDASELRYTIATRHSLQHTLPAGSKTMVDCDFGAAPINSEDFMVSILIKNDGDVTTEW